MKAKYVILEYLTEEPRAFLFPKIENHGDVAQRLEAYENQFIAKLKVVSAGVAWIGTENISVEHGSTTLRIERNPVREELDQKILNSQYRD